MAASIPVGALGRPGVRGCGGAAAHAVFAGVDGAPQVPGGGVSDDLQEPETESAGRVQVAEVTIGLEECLLHHVFQARGMHTLRLRKRKGPPLVAEDQRLEGLGVSGEDAADQGGI